MRKVCFDCVRKHLAQAYVLLNEYADDPEEFEEHLDYAMGHLAEASDESKDYEISKIIRAHRRRLLEDEDYWIDFKPLIRLAIRHAYVINGVEIDQKEYEEYLRLAKDPVQEYLCCDEGDIDVNDKQDLDEEVPSSKNTGE